MTRVGILVSLFLCFLFLCFLPSVVPNQRQLFIVVSDWGSHISCHSPFGVCGILFFVSSVKPAERDVRYSFVVFV